MWKRNIKANLKINQLMYEKFLESLIFIYLISFYCLKIEQAQSIVPYYYFPSTKNLQRKFIYRQKCISTFIFWTI